MLFFILNVDTWDLRRFFASLSMTNALRAPLGLSGDLHCTQKNKTKHPELNKVKQYEIHKIHHTRVSVFAKPYTVRAKRKRLLKASIAKN